MWPGIETELIIAQSSQLAVHIECAQKKHVKQATVYTRSTAKYPTKGIAHKIKYCISYPTKCVKNYRQVIPREKQFGIVITRFIFCEF